jgi:hypothetical protein
VRQAAAGDEYEVELQLKSLPLPLDVDCAFNHLRCGGNLHPPQTVNHHKSVILNAASSIRSLWSMIACGQLRCRQQHLPPRTRAQNAHLHRTQQHGLRWIMALLHAATVSSTL